MDVYQRFAAKSAVREEGFIVRAGFSAPLVDGLLSATPSGDGLYSTRGNGLIFQRRSEQSPIGFVFQFSKKHWWYQDGTTLYQSRDSGVEWSTDDVPPLPSGFNNVHGAANPNRSKVAVMGYSRNSPGQTTLYRSTDLGETWSECFSLASRGRGVIYLGNSTYLYFNNSAEAYLSYDNGENWAYRALFAEDVGNGQGVIVYANRNGMVLCLQSDSNLPAIVSDDFGVTWQSTVSPGPAIQWFFAALDVNPGRMLLGTFKNDNTWKLFRTLDYGLSVVEVTPWPVTDRVGSVVSGGKPGVFFATSYELSPGTGLNGLYVTEDFGETWETVVTGYPFMFVESNGAVAAIALEYNGTGFGTRNRGRTWEEIELPEALNFPQRYFLKGW